MELTGPNTSMKRSISLMSHFTGPATASGSTLIERDRDLRHVVDQVIQQNLDRQHRQERQDQRCAGHAEHVAEIRARAHQNVFGYVLDRAAPGDHGFAHHRKVVFEQDQIGSRARDIGGAIDRNPDIGRMQRRSVIDAIAHEADDMAKPLQRQQDPKLLLRD